MENDYRICFNRIGIIYIDNDFFFLEIVKK